MCFSTLARANFLARFQTVTRRVHGEIIDRRVGFIFFRPFSIFPAWSVSRIRDFKHYSNNLEKLWLAERKFQPDVVYV